MKNIAVTGADGFIGKNLYFYLTSNQNLKVFKVTRDTSAADLENILYQCDVVIHLAGANRPIDPVKFSQDNVDYTKNIVDIIGKLRKKKRFIFASSIHVDNIESDYGASKKEAEELLLQAQNSELIDLTIYRLPHVFGKWSKPNYNSVVATFCNQAILGKELTVLEPSKELKLIYIDDLLDLILNDISTDENHQTFRHLQCTYTVTVGELAEKISTLHLGLKGAKVGSTGDGLDRALFSMLASIYTPLELVTDVKVFRDQRGAFAEVLRTSESGQFSFFTAGPSVTRGGHYHNSKVEKFLVVKGFARFRFRNIVTLEEVIIDASSHSPKIVQTPPGWAHDVTNLGDDELICFVWANENFDPLHPDTLTFPIVE
ncbi:NAD-dependent epimerase/dehydratase family protein [Rhodobacterales bacterium FZCC0188]|nr:NAD-dependent epimerase/dehydratase family protein [Rhodobacterales bacterium FZCC0188]